LAETLTPSQEGAAARTIPTRSLISQLVVASLARLVLHTSRRFAYPFAPALSRGLGVPLTSITSLIAINQATGILSPIFGLLGDRWGYRIMMLAGLSMLTVGMLVGGLLPVYGMVVIALFLAGLGKSSFDPTIQAYVGEHVPYQRRGMAIGVIEFSWAGSSLVGIPLVGLLIDRLGWQSPFLLLGILGFLSLVSVRFLIPNDGHRHLSVSGLVGVREAWQRLSQERAAWGAIAFGFLISAANDNLFVVYGAWLEGAFGLSVLALGTTATVIGLAELLGEGLTASIADRLGLKRVILVGLSLSMLSYLLLPLAGYTLPLTLISLFLIFLTFEFTLVTSLSLFTEILPGSRALMMSSSIAAISIGRVVGALIGGPVWLTGGLLATSLVSAAVSGVALICLAWGLQDWRV
jgi:DHA1 family inner membrane transport protein